VIERTGASICLRMHSFSFTPHEREQLPRILASAYYLPGSRHYERTRIDEGSGERWFCSPEEAEQAGWRAPWG
jgi:hypothetical protein